MADQSPSPSQSNRPPKPRVATCIIARAPLAQRAPSGPHVRLTPTGIERLPAPLPRPRAFEVRMREGLNGCVHIIGHDHAGEPMVEVQMQRKHLHPRTVTRVERWCRELDAEANPDLKLV